MLLTAWPVLPALSFLLALATLGALLLPPLRRRLLDHPNERSLHAVPTPRSGGIGLCLGLLPALLALPGFRVLAGCTLALALLSLWDDWRGLPAAPRLLGHVLVCTVLVGSVRLEAGAALLPLWLLLPLVLGAGWMTNLYNFMDGADGLAGAMAVIGFGCLALAAFGAGDAALGGAALCVAAAAAAFLCLNFPPARIFLGDVGSIPLGFLAAGLGLLGWQRGLWPLWFMPAVFAPFVLDASFTLLRRAMRGERVWQAHREHYYQRLVLLGWSRRRLLAAEASLMAGGGLLSVALLGRSLDLRAAGFLAAAWVYALLLRGVDRAWRRRAA